MVGTVEGEPTKPFAWITFRDLVAAPLAPGQINGSRLRHRVLLVRTNRGQLVKLQVHAGKDLTVRRLVVHSPEGSIQKISCNLRIASGQRLDVEAGVVKTRYGDLLWGRARDGSSVLTSLGKAALYAFPGFDEVVFSELLEGKYRKQPVELSSDSCQVVFLRLDKGRYAKLLVEVGKAILHVRHLAVYDSKGNVVRRNSGLRLHSGERLDVKGGRLLKTRGDIYWRRDRHGITFLLPIGAVRLLNLERFRSGAYVTLLAREPIRQALVWVDERGTRSFDHWTPEERMALSHFVCLREMNQELPIAGPPALNAQGAMSSQDAWTIYLAHVVQSLWTEANTRTPWRLNNNVEALSHLFDMRKLMGYVPGTGHIFGVMGEITSWNPKLAYDFLVNEVGRGYNMRSTIMRLVDWGRDHLVHIDNYGGPFRSDADQLEYLYGYRGLPPVERIISPLPNAQRSGGRRRITAGCWCTSGFLAAVLRTVNVPVRHGRSTFYRDSPRPEERGDVVHSRPEFFLNDLYLTHGDDPYIAWVLSGRNPDRNVPIQRIFLEGAQIRELIDAPSRQPGQTLGQAAAANANRHLASLAVEFKTDYLLSMRCRNVRTGSTELADALRRATYSDDEIRAIEAACDRAVEANPGGCSSLLF